MMGALTIYVDINLDSEDDSATERDFDTAEASLAGLPRILSEVVGRRCVQDVQHGGAAHDDTHAPDEWESLITDHSGRLTVIFEPAADYRDRLITIAALACAAVQSWDRLHKTDGGEP